MTPQEIIRQTYETSLMVLTSYIGDMSDSDLMTRPGDGCNHLAWQLGHLIASECSLLNAVCPGKGITLPEGFEAQHSKENSGEDDPAKFCSKDEYLGLLQKSKEAVTSALSEMTPEALDEPSPEQYIKMFPTVGSVLILVATHSMMHAGQFVPVRRKLEKPVVM